MLKTFSESISTVDTFGYRPEMKPAMGPPSAAELQKVRGILRMAKDQKWANALPIDKAVHVLEQIKNGKFISEIPGEPSIIDKTSFRRAQQKIVEYLETHPTKIQQYKKLLAVKFPPLAKMTVAAAEPIAEKAAKTILAKEGVKITASSLGKYMSKFIPILRVLGYVAFAAWLMKYGWKKLENEAESFSDNPAIPRGDYYNPQKGWY